MAITTSCCLNLPSPTPPSPSKRTQLLLPCHKNDKWRRQCVVSMACVVIGLQMGSFEEAMARDINSTMPLTTVSNADLHQVPRWSDKRMCPPWILNSLETIVPENLPRPSARRRLESIHSYSSKTAPVIIISRSRSSSSDCFSM
ncbi:hypothetical protein Ddye_007608 [Dipteronia dyeriana]|uniref:Uncharacterized protein n=1 Tax=Dipteronia dyeriana TaxID=168575 RepID=A0AAE0CRM2_9ROSI|nr:hypothetical protein Ddye_007608 [Dipteronia dyeriana]